MLERWRSFSLRHRGSPERWFRRLDRTAEQVNPFLIVIAIGLAVLDAVCVITLIDTGRLPVRRGSPERVIAAPIASAVSD